MKTAAQRRTKHRQAHTVVDNKQPMIEHVRELRRRLMLIALSVGVWASAAYGVQQHIVAILLKPAHDQKFIYTSPGGGIDFLFKLCLYAGLIMSIPVIVYHILKYIEPLIKRESTRFIAVGSAISGILAVLGMLYGYFLGLPAALHFLLHQFITTQIQPLLTIQAYMSFVVVYMLGSAMLLQVPLLLILINRIKPLKVKVLNKYQRHVIAASFIVAGLMNPTPNVFALLLIAVPIVVMYQVGIFVIWSTQRKRRPHAPPAHVVQMLEEDATRRLQRLSVAGQAQPLLVAAAVPAAAMSSVTVQTQGASVLPDSPVVTRQRPSTTPMVRRPAGRPVRRIVS
ncbi:MAG TPA: twin-arginine translocase subunit TatC [Candidatus Saccharimonadales bacterium]|nr:twin-arginine translocase subunit TatC [Candidatus Saccharimonadales bacterium]